MDRNISVRHRQKTDIALSWTLRNPVLLAGEIGIENETGKIKIGNGISAWNTLPYSVATLEDIKNAIEKYDADKHSALQEFLQEYI